MTQSDTLCLLQALISDHGRMVDENAFGTTRPLEFDANSISTDPDNFDRKLELWSFSAHCIPKVKHVEILIFLFVYQI